jgi:hypothetical protein
MDNKKIRIALFVGGLILGAVVALVVFSLGLRLDPFGSSLPSSEKNLCEILTIEYLQVRFPHLSVENTTLISVGSSGGANCVYLSEGNDVPVLTFFYSNPNLDMVKEERKPSGATVKEISGIGDEAFFSELYMPDEVIFNSIYFRMGGFGYFLESFKLSDSELVIIAKEAVSKLSQ